MKDEINFTKMNKEILDTENTNYFTKQKYLILSELSALKEDWKWSILVVMIAPICQLFFLSFFVNRSQADVKYNNFNSHESYFEDNSINNCNDNHRYSIFSNAFFI